MRYFVSLLFTCFIVACSANSAPVDKTSVEFRLASFTPQKGWPMKILQENAQKVYLSEDVFAATTDIAEASASFTEQGQPAVIITMTASGKQKIAVATEQNIGKPIGIVVNGKLLSAPLIQEKISGGMLMINGISSTQEAKKIADGLNH